MRPLTRRQENFVNEYLTCWNATEAARRAGYKGNDATLGSVGYENLRKPQIDSRIRARMAESAMRADEVLARLAAIARGDMNDFADADSLSLDLQKANARGKMHLLKSITITTTTRDDGKDGSSQTDTIKFEMYDAQRALEVLGKAHGVLSDTVKINWQAELKAAGLDPDKAVEEVADEFIRHATSKHISGDR
jgi:phage terminase small subunit